MTPERYQLAKEAFETCLGLTTERRAAFLAGCEADIREEVDSLFGAGKAVGGNFLDTPAAELRRIGAYQIVRKVGEGGMGTVYEARRATGDFDQRVAVKLIRKGMESGELLTRFRAERQILAGLSHPNICRLLDGGSTEEGLPYFVMEFIEGQTLDAYCGTMGLDAAARARLLRPVCSAVSYLHQHRILHRDVKPRNILVTAEGVPKLLDFGIAKLIAGDGAETLTLQGAATPRYASPEQLGGRGVDERADVYSLGAVLRELVGQDGVPPALRAIAEKAARYDRDDRYASVAEMAADLDRFLAPAVAARTVSRRYWVAGALGAAAMSGAGAWRWMKSSSPPLVGHSVAVLPFADFSERKDQEPFCDGITEDVIDALSRVPELHVVARTSVYEYKGQARDIRRIAAQLNVDTVVEGSVRKQGEQMRITVQHVRAADGMHLWSQTFDRPVKDVFAVQREIAQAVAGRLGGGQGELPGRVLTGDMEAHRLYLEGRHLFNQGFTMPPMFEKAIPVLEQAVARDPDFVLAYTTLADCHIYLGDFEMRLPANAYPKAKLLAAKALTLDPDSAEAHTSHAVAIMQGEWRARPAERELAVAMRLNPGSAFIHHWHAHTLEAQGRTVEALEEMKAAQRKDPVALYMFWDVSNIAIQAGRIDDALAATDRAMLLHPNAPMTHFLRVCVEDARSNREGAREADRRLRDTLRGQPDFVMAPYRAVSAALAGDITETRRLLRLIEGSFTGPDRVAPAGVFLVYSALNEYDAAAAWLERARRQRNANLYTLARIPPARAARQRDPRIAKILDDVEREFSSE